MNSELRTMKQGSNIREIARLAGVSVASVSRALQDETSSKVSPELRKRILALCEQFQYYPNVHTVRMLSKKAGNVAMIYPPCESLQDSFSAGMIDPNLGACLSGAERELVANGVYLTLTSTTRKFLENREYLRMFRGKMVDGYLVWGWIEGGDYLFELLAEGAPVVMVQCSAGDGGAPSVVADDFDGMRQVVEHVVGLGHRKIAVIPPLTAGSAGRERLRGVMETLNRHGLEPCHLTRNRGFGPEVGYLAGKEIFAAATGATCVIAPNDSAAFGIMQAAREAGVRVPEDVSLTGADGLKIFGWRQLTTYVSPSYKIGETGAQLFRRLLAGERMEPLKTILPVEFIKGETTRGVA